MPAKIDPYWGEKVKSLKENNPKWGAGRITKALKLEAQRIDRNDWPSERWVAGYLSRVVDKLSLEERAQYREFHWPDSMERGDLPWEASGPLLNLLGHSLENTRFPRPEISVCWWYWHLYQARPEMPIEARTELSYLLRYRFDPDKEKELRSAVEGFLASRGWEGDREKAYSGAVSFGLYPNLSKAIRSILDYARVPKGIFQVLDDLHDVEEEIERQKAEQEIRRRAQSQGPEETDYDKA